MSNINWEGWAAITVLLTAAGTFIDAHHMNGGRKGALQKGLIRAFVFLEELPRRFSVRTNRSRNQAPPTGPQRVPIWGMMLLAAVFIWSALWGIEQGEQSLARFNGATEIKNALPRGLAILGALIVGIVSTVLMVAYCFILPLFVFTIPLLILRAIGYLLRFIGMEVFDATSRPQSSPLAYLGALIGLAGLTFEVLSKFVGK